MTKSSNHWKNTLEKVPIIGTFSEAKFQSLELLGKARGRLCCRRASWRVGIRAGFWGRIAAPTGAATVGHVRFQNPKSSIQNPRSKIQNSCPGFTLVELLVTLAVISIIAVLLIPVLGAARGGSARAACASNLRQLAMASITYASEHGYFVAAAADGWTRNNARWHGVRRVRTEAFDPATGPLAPFLGINRRVKQCPSFAPEREGFEHGCGGYGYNAAGVGSQAYLLGTLAGSTRGMAPGAIANAAQTVMFADAAFLQGGSVIEYSFAEPRYHLSDSAPPVEAYPAMPSIHFRHDGYANVAWVDGHISAEPLTTRYNKAFAAANIGWFGPADNSLFDPY